MTLQYSLNNRYFVWARIGTTDNKRFVGAYEAQSPVLAANKARDEHGAAWYQVRESKHGKIAMKFA